MAANRMHKYNLNEITKLIRLYRANECLWNPQSPGFQNAELKGNAWERISKFFKNKLTVDQVKLQILSLRYYFATELLSVKRCQLGGHQFIPRHPFFNELSFLKDAMLNNVHVRVIEAKDQVSKQIKCLVEDAFLLSSSEKSVHSGRVDFPTSSQSDEDDFTDAEPTASFVSSMGEQSLQLPLPPVNISANQFSMRAVSGNDNWNPNFNYSSYGEENNNYDRTRSIKRPDSRTSISSDTVIPNSNQRTVSYPKGNPTRSTIDFHAPRACGPPKRKVLTGRYRHNSTADQDVDVLPKGDSKSYRQHYRFNDGKGNYQNDSRYAKISKDVCRKKSNEDFKNQCLDTMVAASTNATTEIFVNHANVQGSCQGIDACNCFANWQNNNYNENQQYYPQTTENANSTNQPLTETCPALNENVPTMPDCIICNDILCPVRSGKARPWPPYDNQDPLIDQQTGYEPKQNMTQHRNEHANGYQNRGCHENMISDNWPNVTRPNEPENDRNYGNYLGVQDPEECRNQNNRTDNNNMENSTGLVPRQAPTYEGATVGECQRMLTDEEEWKTINVCANDKKKLDEDKDHYMNCRSRRQRKLYQNDDLQHVERSENHEDVTVDSYNEQYAGSQARGQQIRGDFSIYPNEYTNYQGYYPEYNQQGTAQRQPQHGDDGYISLERKGRYNSEYDSVEEDKRITRGDYPNSKQTHCKCKEKRGNESTNHDIHNSERRRDCVDNCFAKCSSGRSRKYNYNPENHQTGQGENRRKNERENKTISPKYQNQYRTKANYESGEVYHGKREYDYNPGKPSSQYQSERDFNEYPGTSRSGQNDYTNSDEYKRVNKKWQPPGEETFEYARRDNHPSQRPEYYDVREPVIYQPRQANYKKRDDEYIQDLNDRCDCPANQLGMDDTPERSNGYNLNREPVTEKYQSGQESSWKKEDSYRRNKEPEGGQNDYGGRYDTQEQTSYINPNSHNKPKKYKTDQKDIEGNRENQDEPNLDEKDVPEKIQTGPDDNNQTEALTANKKKAYNSGDEMQDCESPSDEERIVTLKPIECQEQRPTTKQSPRLCEAAVETDLDMSLRKRKNENVMCYCFEDSLETAEKPTGVKNTILNENTQPANTKSKVGPRAKKVPKMCICKPIAYHKSDQVSKCLNTGSKSENAKQRLPSPTGTKPRNSAKRQSKLDDEAQNSPWRPT